MKKEMIQNEVQSQTDEDELLKAFIASLDEEDEDDDYDDEIVLALPNRNTRRPVATIVEGDSTKNNLLRVLSSYGLEAALTRKEFPIDNKEKEDVMLEILKEKNKEIENSNYLTRISPVALAYFLESEPTTLEDKKFDLIRAASQKYTFNGTKTFLVSSDKRLLSYAPQPASIELLKRIAQSYKKLFPVDKLNLSDSENNIFYFNNTNPYIALGGVLTGDLPLKLFQEKFFFKNSDIHIKNFKTYYELLPEEEKKSEKTINLFLAQLFKDDNYNKSSNSEIDFFYQTAKDIGISSLAYSLKNDKVHEEMGLLSKQDIIAKNRHIGHLSFEELDIDALLNDLNLETKPSSLDEAIKNIKNKKIYELTVAESNLLIAHAIQNANKKGIKLDNISFEFGNEFVGFYSSQDNSITLHLGDWTVEETISTIYHEVNHAVQHSICKTMDIDADSDVIDYSKDEIARQIRHQYYFENYDNLAIEFDADMKAQIEAAAFFYPEKSFEEISNEYDKNRRYKFTSSRTYLNEDTNKSSKSKIDMVFSKLLKEAHHSSPKNYRQLVQKIKNDCPIIEYEYNLETARPRTIQELVSMAQSYDEKIPQEAQKIKIIKHIIKYRCNPDKVGKKEAEKNLKILETMQAEDRLKIEIQNSKDKFYKYSEFFKKLQRQINNPNLENKK